MADVTILSVSIVIAILVSSFVSTWAQLRMHSEELKFAKDMVEQLNVTLSGLMNSLNPANEAPRGRSTSEPDYEFDDDDFPSRG